MLKVRTALPGRYCIFANCLVLLAYYSRDALQWTLFDTGFLKIVHSIAFFWILSVFRRVFWMTRFLKTGIKLENFWVSLDDSAEF